MFQFAVVSACHTPLKSGLPFASRGSSAGREPCAYAFAASRAQIIDHANRDRIIVSLSVKPCTVRGKLADRARSIPHRRIVKDDR